MGVSWGKEGRIIFAGAVGNGGLWSVPADGGTPEQVMKVSDSANETAYAWPDVLPDGSVLFTVLGLSGHAHDARLVVADLTTGVRAVVAEGVTFGRYVEPGFLLYADADGTLLLQPFEVAGRRTVGPARAVLAGARVSSWGGAVPLATSSSGTLVYVTGTELENTFLVQLDLSGRELRRFGQPRAFGSLALSPGGRTLATMTHSSSNDDIFLLDLPSGRFDRFSFDVAEDETPVWSPDGQQLAYSGGGGGEQRRIFVKTIGNAEAPRLVYTGKHHIHLTSWSPDGRWLAFDEINSRSVDIQLLNLQDTTRPVSALTTSADEGNAVFSPDGRWLAYSSKESGRLEVYVVSFPDLGGKHQVSHDGGFQPQWAPNGRELFFFDGYYNFPGRLMRARRLAGSVMSWEAPVTLFDVPRVNDFQVASDGQSIHFIAPNPDAPAREIRVIVNWIEEMKRLVPTK
jgi:hypothetical protein